MKTYLLFDGKLYKIGQSINPEKRLKNLRTGNTKVKIIAYGSGLTEKRLHEIFKNKRVSGEWFKLNNSDVCRIISLIRNEYQGISLSNEILKKHEKNLLKQKELDNNKFVKYSGYVFTFGKYNGSRIIDMNTNNEINYVAWCAKNIRNKKLNKIFKWWVNEHRQADL